MNWCSFTGISDSLSNFWHLKALGVKNIAPSHCTGDKVISLFRDKWADDFIEGGLGAAFEVPRLERHVDIVGMGVIGRLDHSPADLVISV